MLFGQISIVSQNLIDTTQANEPQISDALTDTTAAILLYPVNQQQGSLLLYDDSIAFNEIATINYFTPTEIISQKLSATPLFATLRGNHSSFSFLGNLPSENKLLLNGVNMNDFYGQTNYDALSPEFANKIEILIGSKAAILAGVSGTVVNIQPSLFDTKNPYTRLWYTQGDNKLIGVDGTYSQNFLPNWNITAGFKRLSSNSYYTNSFFDMWNARIMLNHRISDLSSIALIYHFTNYYNGDFGGIRFEDYNLNNNSISQVRSNFTGLSDRQYKTNVILTHSHNSIDTNFTINSNVFWGYLEDNILYNNDTSLMYIDSTGENISSVVNYGANTSLKYNLSSDVIINSGAEIASNNVPHSVLTEEYTGIGYYILGSTIFNIDEISALFGGRYGNKYGKDVFSLGTNISNILSDKWNLFFDASYLKTLPQPIFDYKNEKHLLLILGTKYLSKNNFELNLFYRNIDNPIALKFDKEQINTFTPTFMDIDKSSFVGISGKAKVKLPYNFETSISISDYLELNSETEDNEKYLNNLYLSWLLQYTYTRATSFITLGVEATLLFSDNKLYYNPIFRNYAKSGLSEGFEYDGISAYLVAKLGNCHLRASFKNILGNNFSYLAYYPILKQEFCLSFTWAFLL